MKGLSIALSGLVFISMSILSGCLPSNIWPLWTDQNTGLTWQTKGRDADNPDFRGIIPIEAYEYCQSLELLGHDDWRMPSYAELQSIVAGNPNVQPGGSCQVGTAGAGTAEGKTAACAGTGSGGDFGGPGTGGCYWKNGLEGPCNNVDPFGTHPYETIAADVAHDKPDDWISFITFATGAAGYNHACSLAEVRCVRSDKPAPECVIDGKPCHEYYRSKEYCAQDFTKEADALLVTINLPSDPSIDPPYQLVGFLYNTGTEWYPPLGPPDGGTDFNQVFLAEPGALVINGTTPYQMKIPGTSYYRESLLNGNYQLFFELQLVNTFPPIPVAGDFTYGLDEAPISFPLNGTAHTGEIREMSVELKLVGCPAETPVACADRSCAMDESLCVIPSGCPAESACYPNCPSDQDIYTCLYNNDFDGGNIAMVDYPKSEGWTWDDALTECRGIFGAKTPKIVSGAGQSALVQIGGTATKRCVFTTNGKRSFAQNISSFACGAGSGTVETTGPYCEIY